MYSVSIIMPIYNNEKTLKKSIDSILDQSLYAIELILVNNGSTDSSAQICDDFVKKEPLLVEAIHLEQTELSHAKNTGLYHSNGSFIYFADPTIIYDKNFLHENIKLAVNKKADLVVFGFTSNVSSSQGQFQQHLPRMPYIEDENQFRRHFRNFYHFYPYVLYNKIYRREYLVENRIWFVSVPFNCEALFNLNVYSELGSVVFNRKSYIHKEYNNPNDSIYYDERYFDINLEVAEHLESIIKNWGYEDEFRDLIADEYYTANYYELIYICERNNSLSQEQKEEKVNVLIENEKLQMLLPHLKQFVLTDPSKVELVRLIQKKKAREIINLLSSPSNNRTKLTLKPFIRKAFKLK